MTSEIPQRKLPNRIQAKVALSKVRSKDAWTSEIKFKSIPSAFWSILFENQLHTSERLHANLDSSCHKQFSITQLQTWRISYLNENLRMVR